MNLTLRDLERCIQEIKTRHHDLPAVMDTPVVFVGMNSVGEIDSLDVWTNHKESFQVMIRTKPIIRASSVPPSAAEVRAESAAVVQSMISEQP